MNGESIIIEMLEDEKPELAELVHRLFSDHTHHLAELKQWLYGQKLTTLRDDLGSTQAHVARDRVVSELKVLITAAVYVGVRHLRYALDEEVDLQVIDQPTFDTLIEIVMDTNFQKDLTEVIKSQIKGAYPQ